MSKLFFVYLFILLLYHERKSFRIEATTTTANSSPASTTPLNSTSNGASSTENVTTANSSPVSTTTLKSTSTNTNSDPSTNTNTNSSTSTKVNTTTDVTTAKSEPSTTAVNTTTTAEPNTTTTAEPTTTITVPTTPYPLSSTFTWDSDDINPNPFVVVQVEEGYSISVRVLDVVMPDGGFLLIESGDSHKDDATDGRVFANNVTNKAYLFKTTSVYAYCKVNKNSLYNFKLIFERTGEPTTTVSTTSTTEIIWPTTEEGDSAYITVNVSGRTLKEFNKTKVQEAFKGCLVEMATSYCNDQNIKLQEDITNNNVLITDIDPCPYSWPESETCVRIRFKLPIFYEDDGAESGYLLNSEHLEMMWLRYADGQCFRDNNFATYEEPDFDKYITWWAVGISVVIALFIILLWFLKYLSSHFRGTPKRRNSDQMSIISSKKDSTISLAPHYLQDHMDTPKLFET